MVGVKATTLDDVLYDDDGKVQYAYYRMDNYDTISSVYASDYTDFDVGVDAFRVDWNTTFSIFDSPKEVHVSRYDVAYTDGKYSRVGGEGGYLMIPSGGAFFFSTSPLAYLEDMTTGLYGSEFSDTSMAFASGLSCIGMNVGASATAGENISIVVVTSGTYDEIFGTDGAPTVASECQQASFLTGYDDLHNNPVDYVVNGTCSEVLSGPGGAEDYDNLDSPIKPLVPHYHSRGALYYNAVGSSAYDTNVSSLQVGELRFVQEGYYYGPETMDPWPGSTVFSLHEPDPSSIVISSAEARKESAKKSHLETYTSGPGSSYTPCSFACLDTPGTTETTMRCVAP